MAALKGSKTEQCLKDAFAGESQANRRYLYFANKADVEGQNDVAALFRSTAEGETGHAHGHLEFLEQSGDPATGLPIGNSRQNLQAAVAGIGVAIAFALLPLLAAFILVLGGLGAEPRREKPRARNLARAALGGRSAHWAIPSISPRWPISAITVSPAMVVWPIITLGSVPAGR